MAAINPNDPKYSNTEKALVGAGLASAAIPGIGLVPAGAAAGYAGLKGMGGLSGVKDALTGGAFDRAAEEAYKRRLESISGISLPGQGQFTPEEEEAILAGNTAFENISIDPRLKDAQMRALSKLEKYGEETLTPQEQLALDETRKSVAKDTQGRQASILQGMQQRGLGGAGQELAAQLQASQSGAEQAASEAQRVRAMASQRALESTVQGGQLGGQIRGQEFGEQSDVARAKDAREQFNVAQRSDVQARNVSSRNQAGLYNLEAPQRAFENEMSRGRLVSGIHGEEGSRQSAAGAERRALVAGVAKSGIDAAAKAGGAAATGGMSDIHSKKNISSGIANIRKFLDELEPYSYEYKEPEKFGNGERIGVMAQDLEKTDLGERMVKDSPEGKMVDYGQGFGTILAAQADLNDRLKSLERLLGK